VDKFKGLAAAGEQLPLDDGGRATIAVVHVEDAARILLESPRSPLEIENVVAETTTVAGVAALLLGGEAPEPGCTFSSPFEYRHRLADYL
jgi:nucleoside-diphosphate-sugar epimerase